MDCKDIYVCVVCDEWYIIYTDRVRPNSDGLQGYICVCVVCDEWYIIYTDKSGPTVMDCKDIYVCVVCDEWYIIYTDRVRPNSDGLQGYIYVWCVMNGISYTQIESGPTVMDCKDIYMCGV